MKKLKLTRHNKARLNKIISTIKLQFLGLDWYGAIDHRAIHSERVVRIAKNIISGSLIINQEELFLIYASAWLHDIGLIAWKSLRSEIPIESAKAVSGGND